MFSISHRSRTRIVNILIVGIPCMFYPCTEESSKLVIYFHANAEDVGLAQEFLRPIKETLNVISFFANFK
jgi:hypothetical protein